MTLTMLTNLRQIQKQTLSITPQIKQALYLLRLPLIELQKEVQNAVENNPLLEQDESKTQEIIQKTTEFLQCESNSPLINSQQNNHHNVLSEKYNLSFSASCDSNHDDFYINNDQELSLYDHLYWQCELTLFDEDDIEIAKTIIDYIDERGYLTISLEELSILHSKLTKETHLKQIEYVLKKIQQFDPVGVAARNLSECLLLQLDELAIESRSLPLAKKIIVSHLDLLAQHDYKTLAKIMHITESQLIEPIQLIRSLSPRPGERFQSVKHNYVLPDIIVFKQEKWQVKINHELLPNVRINDAYRNLSSLKNSENLFIQTHLQKAQTFLTGLQNRYLTLLRVTQAIVEHQWQFFEYGKNQLNPLKLADLAQELQLHESTISRATTQKYLICNHGLFELKYFFNGLHLLDNGTETSSSKIKNKMKELIKQENKQKPLSDNQLIILLKKEGINLARRTATKYRKALSIAPSHQRKKLI